MTRTLFLILLVALAEVSAQDRPIKIEVKEIPNRLAFYALNENEKDLDVMLTIKGTNFRQSRSRPIFIRVPATSKVYMKTIVLLRGKKPSYTYDIVVNDSLSRRAVKREFELIKIKPKKNIILYLPQNCDSCDSLTSTLSESIYLFDSFKLTENPEIKEQLQRSFGNTPIDSLKTPIINLGGKLFTQIDTYEALLEELKAE